MKALLYITKRTIINRVKQALKRPITYLYIVGGCAYLFMIAFGFGRIFEKMKFNSAFGLVAIISLWTVYIYGTNFVGYANKKGVLFKPSHTHFIFTAPINPKLILLYGANKNFLMSFIVAVIFCTGGATIFKLQGGQVVLLFLVSFVLEVILEGSQIVFLYVNESLSERTLKMVSKLVYVLLIGIAVFLFWYIRTYGFSLDSIKGLVNFPAIQMIPLIGWNIALYHLILLGPSTINVICSILYILSVVASLMVAVKMKCTGGYYEDAAKFADDYVEFRSKNKRGDTTLSIGKKKTFKKVTSTYEATGAKAIFYRQLLEYKKERFFIFGYMTLVCAALAFVLIKVIGKPSGVDPQFFLLGAMAYMVLLASGYMGKWEKELKNPYIYLIPDTSLKKMWYATVLEHIKAAIDGLIFAVPIGIAWKIAPINVIIVVLTYVILQANKLYLRILADALLGDTLGQTGKNIMRIFIQSAMLGLGVLLALLGGMLINMRLVFPIVLVYSIITTAVIASLAIGRFGNMEQIE